MAWMYRKCDRCGEKEARAEVYGKMNTREYQFSNMSVYCEDCKKIVEEERKIAKEKQRKEESEKARIENQERKLPILQGSEKQIAWAEKIRNEKIKELEEDIEDLENSRTRPSYRLENMPRIVQEYEFFKTETNAGHIINKK